MTENQPNNKPAPRIMIIVWKWLKEISEVNNGKWSVNRTSTGGGNSQDCIYCLRDKMSSKKRETAIHQLIEACEKDAQIYVFLHRSAGYSGNEIRKFLEHSLENKASFKQIKYFLFGEGHDYLYTRISEKGLLATIGKEQEGTFGRSKAGDPADVVQDWENRLINPLNFDNVWEYYTYYFKARIFDLKEDLLLYFCHLPIQRKEISLVDMFDHLKKNDLLHLRVKAFTLGLGDSDWPKIEAFEKKLNETIEHMDDCLPHLDRVYGNPIKELYEKLKSVLLHHLIDPDIFDETSRDTGEVLRDVRNSFRQLLSAMPGETYY